MIYLSLLALAALNVLFIVAAFSCGRRRGHSAGWYEGHAVGWAEGWNRGQKQRSDDADFWKDKQ